MRIAIVDHHVSAGGVSRFVEALAGRLAAQHPEVTFGLVCRQETIDRDGTRQAFAALPNVEVIPIPLSGRVRTVAQDEARVRARGPVRRALVSTIKRSRVLFDHTLRVYRWFEKSVMNEPDPWYQYSFSDEALQLFAQYDLVYLAWPFFMQPVVLPVPMVATFHDLNFKHFPGNYNPELLRLVDSQTDYWLDAADAVLVSTKFIAADIEKHYPSRARDVSVVYLAPYSHKEAEPTEEQIHDARNRFGLPERYAIYSGETSQHKNILGLLRGLDILTARGQSVPLVITGIGTQRLGTGTDGISKSSPEWEVNDFIARSSLSVGQDVFALGYVSNEDVDALTRGAAMVVSPSLYEAGCGPAMDAWLYGVPVAFSDIPPFVEQLEVLDVHAWVFDPNDPRSVASTIREAFDHPELSAQMAEASKRAITGYSWDDVARGYWEVFERVLERAATHGLAGSSAVTDDGEHRSNDTEHGSNR